MRILVLMAAVCVGVLPTNLCAQSQPTFEVDRLNGNSLPEATLKSLSREAVEVEASGTTSTIPLNELEQLRRTEPAPELDVPFLPAIVLQNGSQLGGSGVKIVKRNVEVTTRLGVLSFPVAEVRSLRLAPSDDKLEAAWAEMASRDTTKDLLVTRKGDALDFISGVVGDVDEKFVRLLSGTREVPAPRERVFGIVYVPQPASEPPLCEVTLVSGDRIRVTEASLAGDKLVVKIGSTAKASLPLTEVTSLDFTLGKVKALADLPMTQTQFAKSPLLTSASFEVRKNRNPLGKTLRIGNQEFPRGLWMHSGSSATFRLGREYRRLTFTIGLDSNSTELPRIAPRVKVIISGDGKMIESREVAWDDAPTPLELDVSGVRELEIRVESPREIPGVLEHLVLGEARVIK
jgi:hypothetical protein